MESRRESKFYDSYPNCRIREYLLKNRITTKQFAASLNEACGSESKPLTAEAVRQWIEGYARPDHSKISAIAELMNCSCDYLYGIDRFRTELEKETARIFDLDDVAIEKLTEYRNDSSFSDDGVKAYKAQQVNAFLSDLIKYDYFTDMAVLYDSWKNDARSYVAVKLDTQDQQEIDAAKYAEEYHWMLFFCTFEELRKEQMKGIELQKLIQKKILDKLPKKD